MLQCLLGGGLEERWQRHARISSCSPASKAVLSPFLALPVQSVTGTAAAASLPGAGAFLAAELSSATAAFLPPLARGDGDRPLCVSCPVLQLVPWA